MIKTTWWIFFPLVGLNITDDEHDLLHPVFGDFSIVSRKHMKQVIQSEYAFASEKNQEDMLFSFKSDSFIAIKRKGLFSRKVHIYEEIPTDEEKRLEADRLDFIEKQKTINSATLRAYQIESWLTVILLAESKIGKTCGLREHIHNAQIDHIKSVVMLDFQNKVFSQHMNTRNTVFFVSDYKPITLSSNELKQILFKVEYEHITKVLLQQIIVSESLLRTIREAALRLSDAIYSSTASSQLLGAVTTMEILLAQQNEKYNTLINRLSSLLGIETFTQYNSEAVFHARHLYVHQGKGVEENKIAVNAIGLALNCLIRYAEVAVLFNDKDNLINYLDFLYSGDKLFASSETEQSIFDGIKKYKNKTTSIPFFEFVKKINDE